MYLQPQTRAWKSVGMDIIFNCEHCGQELSVDADGAGTEIECPSCGEQIVIPDKEPEVPPPEELNPIMKSAAAKMEVHYKVPVHEGPSEPLINKPLPTLEKSSKEGVSLCVKTIRHIDCMEVGHDRFDEKVTEFLEKVGEENIVNITPITYTYYDIGTQKLLTDFGVLIVYRG